MSTINTNWDQGKRIDRPGLTSGIKSPTLAVCSDSSEMPGLSFDSNQTGSSESESDADYSIYQGQQDGLKRLRSDLQAATSQQTSSCDQMESNKLVAAIPPVGWAGIGTVGAAAVYKGYHALEKGMAKSRGIPIEEINHVQTMLTDYRTPQDRKSLLNKILRELSDNYSQSTSPYRGEAAASVYDDLVTKFNEKRDGVKFTLHNTEPAPTWVPTPHNMVEIQVNGLNPFWIYAGSDTSITGLPVLSTRNPYPAK